MNSIDPLIGLRNKLVYILIIASIALTTLSLLSYIYVFHFAIWLTLIIIFFGVLTVILKISNKIFSINNPEIALLESNLKDPLDQSRSEIVSSSPFPHLNKSLVIFLIVCVIWVILKTTGFYSSGN